jgi:hypothetical protein
MSGILSVADGTFLDNKSSNTKNEVNMFMPNTILAGDSGGSQNSTVVKQDKSTHGRTRI